MTASPPNNNHSPENTPTSSPIVTPGVNRVRLLASCAAISTSTGVMLMFAQFARSAYSSNSHYPVVLSGLQAPLILLGLILVAWAKILAFHSKISTKLLTRVWRMHLSLVTVIVLGVGFDLALLGVHLR